MLKRIFSHFDECVILLLSGTNFVNTNDVIMVFAYVAPERSPIYSSASVDGIEILGEKIAEITSQYPSTDLLVVGISMHVQKITLTIYRIMIFNMCLAWKLRIPVTVSTNPENHAIIFDFTAAGVVPCGGRKTSPRTSTIVQFIFYFGPLRSAIIF